MVNLRKPIRFFGDSFPSSQYIKPYLSMRPGSLSFFDGSLNEFDAYKFFDQCLEDCILVASSDVCHHIISRKGFDGLRLRLLACHDPRHTFIDAISFIENSDLVDFSSEFRCRPSVHESAHIHPSAVVEDSVYVGPGARVGPLCFLGRGTYVGSDSCLSPGVLIGGNGINLHVSRDSPDLLMFPHLSGVKIGKSVFVGAGSVVNRGIFESTEIGDHSVIGSSVSIGHNCLIGDKVWISSSSVLGGSCVIEDLVSIAAGVTIKNGLVLRKGASVGLGSVLTKSVGERESFFGTPAKKLPRAINVAPYRG